MHMSILSNYNQSQNTFLVRCLFIILIRVSLLLSEEIEYRGRILEFLMNIYSRLRQRYVYIDIWGLGLLILNYGYFRLACVYGAMARDYSDISLA